MIKVKIAGKINLSLKVLGIKDNFHELDMATSSVNIFDVVAISPSKKMSCNLKDIIQEEKNTAFIAGKLFSEKFKTPYVDIKITKGIPIAAGLGGSSADGAAVIFGMMKMFDITDLTACIDLARKIGSDVPLMLVGGLLRVGGTGEKITKIKSNLKFNILTVLDDDGNSAKSVYEVFDKSKSQSKIDGDKIFKALEKERYQDAVANFSNDLAECAIILNPKIQNTLDFLNETGARKSIVYGSGSACGGIFDEFEQAKALEMQFKDKFKFIKALQTIESGIGVIN